MSDAVWHRGGCHCGRVTFEVLAEPEPHVHACNCSICQRLGYLHLIVPKSRFRLLTGETNLTDYRFNTGTALHRFCSTCGIKSFYVPRSHPDGCSVNARCLDQTTARTLHVEPFDGANWEAAQGDLPPLSEDSTEEDAR